MPGITAAEKLNIALNYARFLHEQGLPVTIADRDIVNPYFRTKDSEAQLASEGIGLICSPFANSNLDVPAMPKETYALIDSRTQYGVLDIGGDDRGALALGRYTPEIREENDFEMLLVVNRSRPLTRTPEDTGAVMREIEAACGLPFTGIVNNTNLGQQTEAERCACERVLCRGDQPSDRPAGLHDLLRRPLVSEPEGQDREPVPAAPSETILSTDSGGVQWRN